MTDYFARMRQLTGTTAEWGANDRVIGLGELAIEVVSPGVNRMKLGDGATLYSALPYYDPGVGTFVMKAGDTMTGTLTTPGFNVPDSGGSATVPTMVYTDASRHVATTAFVKNLLATRGQGNAIYQYGGATFGVPPTGKVIIDPTVDPARHFAINATDADGIGRYLPLLQPGDSIVITNETTPVTYYARYDLTSDVTDHTAWVEFNANLVDLTGAAEAPPLNTRLKLTGYLNLATGDGPILGVTAGTGLTGGGSVGVVQLDVDPTKVVMWSMADAAGDLIVGTGVDTLARLAKGTTGQHLVSTAAGVAWGGLITDTTLAAPATTLNVDFPAGTKVLEIYFAATFAAAGGSMGIIGRRGGTGDNSSNYNTLASQTWFSGSAASGSTWYGNNASFVLNVSPQTYYYGRITMLNPGGTTNIFGNADFTSVGLGSGFVRGRTNNSFDVVNTITPWTGFQLYSSINMQTGSWVRAFAY